MNRCSFCAATVDSAAVACRACGRETDASARAGTTLAAVLRGGEVALCSGALVLVAYLLAVQAGILPVQRLLGPTPGAAEEIAPPPLVLSLLDAQTMEIAAGEHFDTTFVVSDPRRCVFTGQVQGLAGGNRDVEVYLLDDRGFEQWHEEVRPTALFASGRAASATLEVPLPGPGKYALLLSNRYSFFTDKTVHVDAARVTCQ